MAGILSVWNDCAPEGLEHFERWYNSEHLLERVGVPGFRFGRRYELVSGGDRRFMAFYEVDSPAVLNSPAYLERLENPTPWTSEAMKSFRGMVRTVCDLKAIAGNLIGSHVVVLRADEAMTPTPSADKLVAKLAAEDGIARAQLWTAAAQQTKADTAEMKSRGQDRLIAGALVVECVRRSDADRVAARLAADGPPPSSASAGPAFSAFTLCCVSTTKLERSRVQGSVACDAGPNCRRLEAGQQLPLHPGCNPAHNNGRTQRAGWQSDQRGPGPGARAPGAGTFCHRPWRVGARPRHQPSDMVGVDVPAVRAQARGVLRRPRRGAELRAPR
jgi:hypothetical protein